MTHTLGRRGPIEQDARTGIGMKIEITVESLDPPLGLGHVSPGRPAGGRGEGDRGVEFVGWLGLLRVLDDLIGAAGPPCDPP